MRPQHLIATLLLFSMTSCTNSPEQEKLKAIDSHSEAVYIHDSWVRDPYIILADDGYYYLTGTMPLEDDERQYSDRYNIGLNEGSIVGNEVRLWRSVDLVNWESLGSPYSLKDTFAAYDEQRVAKKRSGKVLWAPELHQVGGRWALVHCPQIYSTLALSEGSEITNSWSHPSVDIFYQKHDPSLFCDDGVWYLLWGNTSIARINSDFTALETKPVRIDPSDRVIGHEGATMRKIGDKYVHFGTAWSADNKRTGGGSYNLYYCTSDCVMGPYSERRFAGRFLGHGTPFQDKSGNWWCTAFFNGDVPPVDDTNIESVDLGGVAQSINEQGTTIVPLEVRILEDGDIFIRAKDPRYRNPGPDEVQHFERID